jgi:hypothetical protein
MSDLKNRIFQAGLHANFNQNMLPEITSCFQLIDSKPLICRRIYLSQKKQALVFVVSFNFTYLTLDS